jgi:hypothetical protein
VAALRARLTAKDRQIADLKAQLRNGNAPSPSFTESLRNAATCSRFPGIR